MKRFSKIAMFSLAAFTALGAAEAADKKDAAGPPDLGRAVRQSLENLSYYGVFDILSYQMGENGAVELSGYVFNNTLKDDAEDAVLKVPGVKTVVNRIEELDWGVQDDEIRAKVYLNIYRDTFLSRYGTPADMALANGVAFGGRGRFGVFGIGGIANPHFPGFNPVGDYGIHILVTNGEVILVGEVDNIGDKNLAGMKARSAFPVKQVYNELTVKGEKTEPGVGPAPKVKPGKGGVVAVADGL